MESLIAIVSKVPERISQYASKLRSFSTNFQFVSDVDSLVVRHASSKLRLIILDNENNNKNLVISIRTLRQVENFSEAAILVIVDAVDSGSGVSALNAGANDYLAAALVDKELTARARLHWSVLPVTSDGLELDFDLEAVYPLEDRLILIRALGLIKTQLSSISRVGELAFRVGCNEKQLSDVFSTHLGQSVFAYMRTYRINKAKEQLVKTRIPITQIAHDVGYSSSANFSTAFKSVVGVSPAQYRAQSFEP